MDHVVPVAKGGTNDLANLVTSCRRCNLGKGVQSVAAQPLSPVRAPMPAGIEIQGRVYDFDYLTAKRRFIFRETALTPHELVHACSLSDGERAAFMVRCWLGHFTANPRAFRKTEVWAMYGEA